MLIKECVDVRTMSVVLIEEVKERRAWSTSTVCLRTKLASTAQAFRSFGPPFTSPPVRKCDRGSLHTYIISFHRSLLSREVGTYCKTAVNVCARKLRRRLLYGYLIPSPCQHYSTISESTSSSSSSSSSDSVSDASHVPELMPIIIALGTYDYLTANEKSSTSGSESSGTSSRNCSSSSDDDDESK